MPHGPTVGPAAGTAHVPMGHPYRTLANPNLPTPGTPLPAPAPAAAPVHPPTHALEASAHAAHALARPSQGHEPTPTGGSH